MKLTNGHFVVSHGNGYSDVEGVCIVDTDGKLIKSFGGKRGSGIEQMYCPIHLSVDGNGFVLVADQLQNQVLLLDSNLKFQREFLCEGRHELNGPSRILLDESCDLLLVGESFGSRSILIFQLG